MDLPLLGCLMRMRYRLLWAQTRTRNGKIALFVAFYLLVVFCVVLLAMGGLGAAAAAVRTGKAELVARLVLAGFFANALVSSVILGFGMNVAFSDAALRRFPLAPLERLAARQLTGLAEPLWFVVFSLYFGLAAGLSVLGVSSFWAGAAAMLLLVIDNYLLARVLADLIDRLMQTRGGPAVMIAFIFAMSIGPSMMARKGAAGRFAPLLSVLSATPPFAGASIVAGAGWERASMQFLLLGAWAAAMFALLFLLERRPVAPRAESKAAAAWDSRYDRVASWFGPRYAPLAGKALRYYLRSPRVRYNYFLTVPMLVFFTYSQSRRGSPEAVFVSALGAIAAAGFIGTAAMAVNAFGYDAGGFRRYFLLPGSAADAFRAVSLTSLFLGVAMVPPSLAAWLLFAPLPTTPAMFVMLLSSGLGGLLFFNAGAIWTSVYAPRRTEFGMSFGNNLSLPANLLVIGGMIFVMLGPTFLRATKRTGVVLNHWWVFPLFLVLSAVFYRRSLAAGSRAFMARRERMLAVIEGRS